MSEHTSTDGLANVLSKILAENTGSKGPVLSKRKTEAMRNIETENENLERIKVARVQRKQESLKQQKLPHEYSIEHEKSLRKIATKGVVALFNAISTNKRNNEANGTPATLSNTKLKLQKRTEGQLRKQNGLKTGTSKESNDTAAVPSAGWSVLTDGAAKFTTKPSSATSKSKPKPSASKTKTKHWDEGEDDDC